MAEAAARKLWEIENNVKLETDDIYLYDEAQQDRLRQEEPWKKECINIFDLSSDLTDSPKYFKKVKISGISLLKMVLHARAGCSEIPGKVPRCPIWCLL